MEQGINLAFVLKRRNQPDRPLAQALELCQNAGFTALDYLTDVQCPDYLERARKARREIDRLGLRVEQSHCPFFRYQMDAEPGALFRKFAPRAAEAAAILGARFLVIHADEYRVENTYDVPEILDFTHSCLTPTVELCSSLGVKPAFENVFEDGCGHQVTGCGRFCSRIQELLDVIRMFPGSGCCWDFGHAQVASKERAMDEFAAIQPYLFCTHVHDNTHGADLHKPAFFGDVPWESAMDIMKRGGYSGVFSWEFVYERFPDALMPGFLQFVHETGEYLDRL
ncbi:MAG: sugar phosphate isomerase/epimerase [Victivallales bacterium]|nr:sugar phosphate isomerase/epimerase [Victivallales bacterium]